MEKPKLSTLISLTTKIYTPITKIDTYNAIKEYINGDEIEKSLLTTLINTAKKDLLETTNTDLKVCAIELLESIVHQTKHINDIYDYVKVLVDIKSDLESDFFQEKCKKFADLFINGEQFDNRLQDEDNFKKIVKILRLYCLHVTKQTCYTFIHFKVIPTIFASDISQENRELLVKLVVEMPPGFAFDYMSKDVIKKFKTTILKDYLQKFDSSNDLAFYSWYKYCILIIRYCGKILHTELELTNSLLKIVEIGFKIKSAEDKTGCYSCWKELVINYALDKSYLSNLKHVKLLVKPLNAKLSKIDVVVMKRYEVFALLVEELENTSVLCLENFIVFLFGPIKTDSIISDENESLLSVARIVKECWPKSTEILLKILGHDKKTCCKSKKTYSTDIFKIKTYLTTETLMSSSHLFVNSVRVCSELTLKWMVDEDIKTTTKCLWYPIFNTLKSVPEDKKEEILQLISTQIIYTINRYSNDVRFFEFILTTICDVIISFSNPICNIISLSRILFYPIINTLCKKIEAKTDKRNLNGMKLLEYSRKRTPFSLFFNDVAGLFEDSNKGSTLLLEISNFVVNYIPEHLKQKPLQQIQTDDIVNIMKIFLMIPNSQYTEPIIAIWNEASEKNVIIPIDFKNTILTKLVNISASTLFDVEPFCILSITLLSIITKEDIQIFDKWAELTSKILLTPNLNKFSMNKMVQCMRKAVDICIDFNFNHDVLFESTENLLKIHQINDILGVFDKLLSKLTETQRKQIPRSLMKVISSLIGDSKTYVSQMANKVMQKLETSKERSGSPNTTPISMSRAAKIAKMVNQPSSGLLRLFGQDIDTKSPIKIKGSILNSPKSSPKNSPKVANQMPIFSKKTKLDDCNSQDFVAINKEVIVDIGKLSEHQVDMMKRRREDIPALYQDLTQSQDAGISNDQVEIVKSQKESGISNDQIEIMKSKSVPAPNEDLIENISKTVEEFEEKEEIDFRKATDNQILSDLLDTIEENDNEQMQISKNEVSVKQQEKTELGKSENEIHKNASNSTEEELDSKLDAKELGKTESLKKQCPQLQNEQLLNSSVEIENFIFAKQPKTTVEHRKSLNFMKSLEDASLESVKIDSVESSSEKILLEEPKKKSDNCVDFITKEDEEISPEVRKVEKRELRLKKDTKLLPDNLQKQDDRVEDILANTGELLVKEVKVITELIPKLDDEIEDLLTNVVANEDLEKISGNLPKPDVTIDNVTQFSLKETICDNLQKPDNRVEDELAAQKDKTKSVILNISDDKDNLDNSGEILANEETKKISDIFHNPGLRFEDKLVNNAKKDASLPEKNDVDKLSNDLGELQSLAANNDKNDFTDILEKTEAIIEDGLVSAAKLPRKRNIRRKSGDAEKMGNDVTLSTKKSTRNLAKTQKLFSFMEFLTKKKENKKVLSSLQKPDTIENKLVNSLELPVKPEKKKRRDILGKPAKSVKEKLANDVELPTKRRRRKISDSKKSEKKLVKMSENAENVKITIINKSTENLATAIESERKLVESPGNKVHVSVKRKRKSKSKTDEKLLNKSGETFPAFVGLKWENITDPKLPKKMVGEKLKLRVVKPETWKVKRITNKKPKERKKKIKPEAETINQSPVSTSANPNEVPKKKRRKKSSGSEKSFENPKNISAFAKFKIENQFTHFAKPDALKFEVFEFKVEETIIDDSESPKLDTSGSPKQRKKRGRKSKLTPEKTPEMTPEKTPEKVDQLREIEKHPDIVVTEKLDDSVDISEKSDESVEISEKLLDQLDQNGVPSLAEPKPRRRGRKPKALLLLEAAERLARTPIKTGYERVTRNSVSPKAPVSEAQLDIIKSRSGRAIKRKTFDADIFSIKVSPEWEPPGNSKRSLPSVIGGEIDPTLPESLDTPEISLKLILPVVTNQENIIKTIPLTGSLSEESIKLVTEVDTDTSLQITEGVKTKVDTSLQITEEVNTKVDTSLQITEEVETKVNTSLQTTEEVKTKVDTSLLTTEEVKTKTLRALSNLKMDIVGAVDYNLPNKRRLKRIGKDKALSESKVLKISKSKLETPTQENVDTKKPKTLLTLVTQNSDDIIESSQECAISSSTCPLSPEANSNGSTENTLKSVRKSLFCNPIKSEKLEQICDTSTIDNFDNLENINTEIQNSDSNVSETDAIIAGIEKPPKIAAMETELISFEKFESKFTESSSIESKMFELFKENNTEPLIETNIADRSTETITDSQNIAEISTETFIESPSEKLADIDSPPTEKISEKRTETFIESEPIADCIKPEEIPVSDMDTESVSDNSMNLILIETPQKNGKSMNSSSLSSSPVTVDTPRKDNEFLNVTADISPIKVSERSTVWDRKVSSPDIFSSENVDVINEIIEPAANLIITLEDVPIEAKFDEIPPTECNIEGIPTESKFEEITTLKVPSSRSAKLLLAAQCPLQPQLVLTRVNKSLAESSNNKPAHVSSPKTDRIKKMMQKCEENNVECITLDSDDEIQLAKVPKNILKFAREVPSPLATPKLSILKRKVPETFDEGLSPCAKRKRVNFSDPPTTCEKIYFKELEEHSHFRKGKKKSLKKNASSNTTTGQDPCDSIKSLQIQVEKLAGDGTAPSAAESSTTENKIVIVLDDEDLSEAAAKESRAVQLYDDYEAQEHERRKGFLVGFYTGSFLTQNLSEEELVELYKQIIENTIKKESNRSSLGKHILENTDGY